MNPFTIGCQVGIVVRAKCNFHQPDKRLNMAIEIPQPVAAYPLPDGRTVSTPEEYVAEIAKTEVVSRAETFIAAHPELTEKRLTTRYRNIIAEFLTWELQKQAIA